MPLGEKRNRALYGILHHRGGAHRYTIARWVVGIAFTAMAAALPWTDTLRFDLWRGQHMWRGQQVSLTEAARQFAFPFLAVNVVIIIGSRSLGRYLCGFVCPVGALARIGEWATYTERKRRQRVLAPLVSASISILLAAITFSFWVDPLVFLEGSTTARWVASLFLFSIAAGLFVIVQGVGLSFCRDACPSGIYFALLGHESVNGIEFAHAEGCTDCGLCKKICPMDLEPRVMSGGAYRGRRGLYGEDLSNFANCIRCGDCVVACEAGSGKDSLTPLRMGFLPADSRDARAPAASEDTGVEG